MHSLRKVIGDINNIFFSQEMLIIIYYHADIKEAKLGTYLEHLAST